jgi:hypothetical protein
MANNRSLSVAPKINHNLARSLFSNDEEEEDKSKKLNDAPIKAKLSDVVPTKKQIKKAKKDEKSAAKKELKNINKERKSEKTKLKQQRKIEKAQFKRDEQQQNYDLAQAERDQELRNRNIRSEAENAGRYIPYGARDIPTATHSTVDQPVAIRNTTPNQDVLLGELFNRVPQGVQNLNLPGSQSSFAPIANEARRNFSQKTIPGLAERFAGLGNNRLQSSGFAQALGGAAGDFESQLAAQQAQYGLQEQGLQSNNLFNALSAYLHPQQDTTIIPGSDSSLRQGWNSVKGLAGQTALNGISSGLSNLLNRGGQSNNNSQQGQGGIVNGTGLGQDAFQLNSNQRQSWSPKLGLNPSTFQF